MPKLREKPIPQVAQKILITPRRQTPVQNPKQRKIRVSPMKRKSAVANDKSALYRKVFGRRKPHPRSPSKDAKQLLATGKSPNCFSFKSEFLHTPYVLKPVLHTEDAYDAVSKMIHISHDEIQERMIRIKVGKKRKYPKRDGSYLDRHYDELARKQQESLQDKETQEDTTDTDLSNDTTNSDANGPNTVIRQNSDGSVYIRVQDLVICEYPPSVFINMMSKEMVELYLARPSKPNFNFNPFYQKLATVTINSIRERNLLKVKQDCPPYLESEQ